MLTWNNVSFAYGEKQILDGFSEEIRDGEILAVMGPSGCGKSTLLALAAGLRKPTSGSIENRALQTAVVFQEPRLLPWYNVRDNLMAVLPKHTPAERIRAALDAVELTGSETLFPDELSGGMKSRVAIARALAYGGDLYLLDEPFAALNDELRGRLGQHVRAHIKESGACAMLVTHHVSDAEALADRILRMPTLTK